MKNTFKFMGIALMATALLFTSCKKDDQDGNDTTPAPQTETSSAKVMVNGSQVTGLNYADTWTNGQIFYFETAAGLDGNHYVLPAYSLAVVYFQNKWYISDELIYNDGTAVSDEFPNMIMTEDETVFLPAQIMKNEVSKFDANNNVLTLDFELMMYNDDVLREILAGIFEAEGFTQEEIDAMDATSYNEFARQAMAQMTDDDFADYEVILTKYKFIAAQQ